MFKKLILVSVGLSVSACSPYSYHSDDAYQAALAQHATADQIVAQIDMNVTVCTARADAAVPSAKYENGQTLASRARLIKWAKVSDACLVEHGGKLSSPNYPTMADMEQCDRAGRKSMPGASAYQQNTFIDDCLETKGFNFPGH